MFPNYLFSVKYVPDEGNVGQNTFLNFEGIES